MEVLSIKDVMTKEFVSFSPEMPLLDAAKILIEHELHGAPVVDDKGVLVGILTESDLISRKSFIHLPTLQIVLKDVNFAKDNVSKFKEFQDIVLAKVQDAMNQEPLTLEDSASFQDAVKAFREHHRVNPIPVIDGDRRVVGVISRFDLLKIFPVNVMFVNKVS